MLTFSARQEALLRLPDLFDFLPKLAGEIRRDMPERVLGMDDAALLAETDRCYAYAAYELGITHLPVLVAWTKTDVGSGGELHRNAEVDIAIRHAEHPSTKAADVLGALAALHRWPKGEE
ncbi:hypothetical protein NJH49_05965 [Stenotrophomonas maltophilia]|jgi:hypothetical protein|uniref:Uncharacterized protein n=1 Tax=Stenotrophomonas maltophilia TaxID=40324 RepID=A0AAP7GWE9_STEMA|nr:MULTISPECIES: hypothetical protein [Stenotrophomonas]KOQ69895.1 hypothetical protein ABW43_07825 [Stenotrophomonas maltophilia]MBA0222045.1 hypothetical protein [Stenotrophomonas maltophilia]MBE5270602.1 hypothetical protein [Stenotrophomonas sp. B2]MCO7398450.1 hypothetical protein [Stenotrophomonas maltophilia]MCO7410936.1 hypothetical protein [Stenotrophomonas maltophilia]